MQTERTRSMLLFANVSARHYGNYTCRAANRLGASSASMRLLRASSGWAGRGGARGRGMGGAREVDTPGPPLRLVLNLGDRR